MQTRLVVCGCRNGGSAPSRRPAVDHAHLGVVEAVSGRRLAGSDGHAVVTGPLGFAACFRKTAYTDSAIKRGSLQPGDSMCVRTNGHSLALVTIFTVSEEAVEFGATVWDPPVPS